MKLITLLLAPLSVSALSNVAPGTFERKIKGIVSDDFDPTAGENAAMLFNNKDEVWVPQVHHKLISDHIQKNYEKFNDLLFSFFTSPSSALVLGVIENHQR
jgi:hypothetical protein